METDRLEAFADGVFAIAATLLIIDVTVPARSTALGHALVHAWPEYAAYAVSFVTIGIMWLNHHQCLRQIGAADRTFMVLNLFLLMCIAFVPFPTKLVALHLRDQGERAAALTYGVTLTLTSVFFGAFWFYAARGRRLIAENADQRLITGISRSYLPGVPMYGAATLVALWNPKVAVGALRGLIALFYVFESSDFGGAEPDPHQDDRRGERPRVRLPAGELDVDRLAAGTPTVDRADDDVPVAEQASADHPGPAALDARVARVVPDAVDDVRLRIDPGLLFHEQVLHPPPTHATTITTLTRTANSRRARDAGPMTTQRRGTR